MIDYVLNRLVDGISLPGIILILLPVVFLHWWITKKRWLFLPAVLFFIVMSIPLSGKLLLYPLEVGTPFKSVKVETLAGKIDAIAVISNGLYHDYLVEASVANTSSFSRVKRGDLLRSKLDIPLILSGTLSTYGDKADADVLAELIEDKRNLFLVSGAAGTADHAKNIQNIISNTNIKRLAVLTSGIHAYRTAEVFEKQGLDIPIVIVGLNYSNYQKRDYLPSFKGFFYWKHALKEYAGLAYYFVTGKIS